MYEQLLQLLPMLSQGNNQGNSGMSGGSPWLKGGEKALNAVGAGINADMEEREKRLADTDRQAERRRAYEQYMLSKQTQEAQNARSGLNWMDDQRQIANQNYNANFLR